VNQDAKDLLEQITDEMDRNSTTMHTLARRQQILKDAATRLRMGVAAGVIAAQLADELPAPTAPTSVFLRRMR